MFANFPPSKEQKYRNRTYFWLSHKHTSPSCFSIISTPLRSVLRSGTAQEVWLEKWILEKLYLTCAEGLSKLSATSNMPFAKTFFICNYSEIRFHHCGTDSIGDCFFFKIWKNWTKWTETFTFKGFIDGYGIYFLFHTSVFSNHFGVLKKSKRT